MYGKKFTQGTKTLHEINVCGRLSMFNVNTLIGGSNPDTGWEFFSLPPRPDRLWNPPSLLSNVYYGFFPGVKRPGREADHSVPFSAEVKNVWSCTSTPPIRLHGVVLS
jgi:hypothetical protein